MQRLAQPATSTAARGTTLARARRAGRGLAALRAAARLGQRGLLKVLLNQEDPNQIARLSQNYKYLSAAQLREISAFEELIQKLVDNETQLNLEVARASEAASAISRAEGELKVTRVQLAKTAASLQAAFDSSEDERLVLEEDKNTLLQLLAELRRNLFGFPKTIDFASMTSRKGTLDLPAQGSIRHRFGEKRLGGRIRWDGLVINADSGSKVSAVQYPYGILQHSLSVLLSSMRGLHLAA